jgi:hypothetical protein
MPKATKGRMSFAPATPSPANEPRATTGWVYRSDLHGGPEMAPKPPDARSAPAKPWRSSTYAAALVDAVTLPFTVAILLAMPWARWLTPIARRSHREITRD